MLSVGWHRQGTDKGAGGYARGLLVTAAVVSSTLAGSGLPAQAGDASIERNTATLRWLDKATARVETLDVPVGQLVRIQTLDVIVRACKEHPPEEPPESAAFLEVSEHKAGEAAEEVFRGWMFASSPALSAMEHPVYDLWVLGCSDNKAAATGVPVNSIR